jgi:rSAM/selenodomain-associated transferase 2
MKLSIVIPTLDEAAVIEDCLRALRPLRAGGHEIIVADGGSRDGTPQVARALCDRLVSSPRGRATQMNAGATMAQGDILVFLHADSRLPAGADAAIIRSAKSRLWGRFDVQIEGRHPLLKVIAWSMNLRSRLTGIATGDQAIFVRRAAFAGFAEIPLMEDIAFSKAMKRRGAPACLRERVITSGRRWERRGVLRTILLMWRLRLMYFLGTPADDLARLYHG